MASKLIGSSRHFALTVFQKFGLVPFREILPSEEFAAVAAETGCAPKRNRPLIPEAVVWLMTYVALETTSMTQGLIAAWGLVRAACPWINKRSLAEEAFCRARGKLTLRFWHKLWDRLRSRYEGRFNAQMLWKETYRVLAVDGTVANLQNQPALAKFFTRPKGKGGQGQYPQGRLVAMCSVFTGFCLHFKFLSLLYTEHHALRHLIRRLRPRDLLLLDRGFFSYGAIWFITSVKAQFLARVSDQVGGFAKRIKRLGPDDWLVEFRPTSAIRRKCPGVPEVIVSRLIRYQFNGFRPSWLLTSLMDPEAFSRQEMVNLYHQRWTIETIYREWKHALDIQNLRSTTPAAVIKEIHAHLLLSNLVRWVMTEAAEGTGIMAVDLSFTEALGEVRSVLPLFMTARPHRAASLYEELVATVRGCKIRKRPGRSYPRRGEHKIKNKGRGKRQMPSRLSEAKTLS